MLRFEDYRQLANRSAQLAIAASPPSVSEALLTLALNYISLGSRGTSAGWHNGKCSKIRLTGYGD